MMIVPALAGLFLFLPNREASAFTGYIAAWRANYPAACTNLYQLAQSCTLCHGAGFSLNAYGDDLAANGIDYDLVGLLDSDGDGRSNDDEINVDCTEPADAASPAEAATWGNLKALFTEE
jgi:hypothetical protein